MISFELNKKSWVQLILYNLAGKEVKKIAYGEYEQGKHTINFNATNLTSGLYLYKLKTGNFVAVKKMIVLN